jgi:hypothetical protein
MHYLVGPEAIDVARMTGLPLRSSLHRAWEASDIAADAVRATDHVYLDVGRMCWWDQFRVAWARIGAYCWLNAHPPRARADQLRCHA